MPTISTTKGHCLFHPSGCLTKPDHLNWLSGPKAWTFTTVEKTPEGKRRVELIRATQIHIKRHAKVRSEANPFDPEYAEYFARRRTEQQRRYMGCAALAAA
jgi:RNA-directed DNA polymerase